MGSTRFAAGLCASALKRSAGSAKWTTKEPKARLSSERSSLALTARKPRKMIKKIGPEMANTLSTRIGSLDLANYVGVTSVRERHGIVWLEIYQISINDKRIKCIMKPCPMTHEPVGEKVGIMET